MVMDTNRGDGVYALVDELNDYLWPHSGPARVHHAFTTVTHGDVRHSAADVEALAAQLREATAVTDRLLQAITS